MKAEDMEWITQDLHVLQNKKKEEGSKLIIIFFDEERYRSKAFIG
jgi:hypothetical protein